MYAGVWCARLHCVCVYVLNVVICVWICFCDGDGSSGGCVYLQ